MTARGRYRHLFSPLRIGPVTVANRIVFAAHLTNYAEDGGPSEQHAAYYAARAAGGAGLIVTEEHSTHPTDWPYEKLIHGFRPDVVPGYRRITEAVHAHGVPIFAQINHNGGQGSGMYSRLPVWAPSPVADPLFREVPKEITGAEIAEVVAGYATVAGHCAAGGFDGIELQCSHSSIVRAFLSPWANRRTDRYGGTLANRMRVLLEIVAAVREAIGRDRALGVRLCGDELIEGGIVLDEAVEVARALESTGLVDYVNTSIGVATMTLFMIEASMHVPPGYALFVPSAVRKAVDLPVVGVGRFKDPLQAERAIEEGHCDLVGVVRGQIADADFAAKARAGAAGQIRLCLSCNQECVGRMGQNRWVGCIESPRTGREATAPAGPATRRRRVLVAGAGPAGLQAAIAATARGHAVTVHEREPVAGGQVRVAATVPSRAELGDLVRNQLAECRRLGVEIRYGSRVDLDLVRAEAPDAVVVATGAEPARPWWAPPAPVPEARESPLPEAGQAHAPEAGQAHAPEARQAGPPEASQASLPEAREAHLPEAREASGPGVDGPPVVDVRDVLEGAAAPAGRVVVVDELGFHQATSVAELLADRGCRVEVLAPAMVVGQDLGVTLDMEGWCTRAAAKGIVQTPDSVVMGMDGGKLQVLHHPTGRTASYDVDWVVLAVPQAPAEALYLDLKAARLPGVEVHRAGDCVAPRRAHAAVVEGDRIGAAL